MQTNNNLSLLYTLNSVTRLKNISEPLQSYLGIRLFGYTRIYNDCRYFKLSNGFEDYFTKHITSIEMQDNIFKNAYRNTLEGEPNFLLWPTKYETLPPVASLHHQHDIWNGLSINYRNKEYIENFFFAFGRDSEDKSQFYMQNQQLLLKFCDYFKIEAEDLISNQDTKRLASYTDKFDISPFETNALDREDFFAKIINKKTSNFFDKRGNVVSLTARESECISILMQNRTIKEISKILNLSPRTVEHYIENVKRKFEVNYKSQLVDIFLNNTNSHL